jgi:hypothetical protein
MTFVRRPLGHALYSHSLITRKSFCVSVGRSFPIDCTRPTGDLFPLFVRLSTVIFQRRVVAKRYAFLFLEEPYRISRRLFYCFRAKSLQPHGLSRLFFLLDTCESSGAEGCAREAYFSGLSELPRKAAHVKVKIIKNVDIKLKYRF